MTLFLIALYYEYTLEPYLLKSETRFFSEDSQTLMFSYLSLKATFYAK